jgi:hypothetical protein
MLIKIALLLFAALVMATPADAANGSLSWPAAPNATSYEVQGCSGVAPGCGASDPAWTKIQTVTTLGLSETGLPVNVRMCRRVIPLNAFGPAAATTPMCASADTPGPISGQLIWTLTPGP